MRITLILILISALYSCRTQQVSKTDTFKLHDTIYIDSSHVDTVFDPCKDSLVIVENERVVVRYERLQSGLAKLSGTAKADTIYRVKQITRTIQVDCPKCNLNWSYWLKKGWHILIIAIAFGFILATLRR